MVHGVPKTTAKNFKSFTMSLKWLNYDLLFGIPRNPWVSPSVRKGRRKWRDPRGLGVQTYSAVCLPIPVWNVLPHLETNHREFLRQIGDPFWERHITVAWLHWGTLLWVLSVSLLAVYKMMIISRAKMISPSLGSLLRGSRKSRSWFPGGRRLFGTLHVLAVQRIVNDNFGKLLTNFNLGVSPSLAVRDAITMKFRHATPILLKVWHSCLQNEH